MRFKALLYALLFTIVMTGPELFELFRFHGFSPKTFSDWDEPYYFPIAMSRGRELLAWLQGRSAFSGNYLLYLFTIAPQEVLAAGVGLLETVLEIKATVLGAMLDVAISFLSFFVFSLLFRALGFSPQKAAAATIVTLFFPWLLYLPQFFHIPLNLGPGIVSVPHGLYPCQPIVRGLGTQLSYPLFGLALFLAVRAVNGRSTRGLFLSGFVSGLLIYVYFFAWPAAIGLIGLYVLLSSGSLIQRCGRLLLFTAPAFAISSPAIAVLYSNYASPVQAAAASTSPTQVPDALWYFSPEQFLLLAVLAVWLFRRCQNDGVRLCVAALVAEFLLMNTQKVLGIHTAPYHFPLLYLNPVLSGALFVSVVNCLKNIELKALPSLLLGAAMVLIQGGQLNGYLQVTAETREFTALVREIEAKVPASGQIVFAPSDENSAGSKEHYHYFTIPYWVNAITERPLFANFVGSTPDGMLPKDLEIGWIYFGTLKPYLPCPASLPSLPGDILSGMMTREYWNRYFACKSIPEFVRAHGICDIVRENPFDFVVWQHSVVKEIPSSTALVTESLWRSSGGEYELLRFKRSEFFASQCAASAPDTPQETTSTPIQ